MFYNLATTLRKGLLRKLSGNTTDVLVGDGTWSSLSLTGSTYTPTLTGVANVDASTAYSCQYIRIGTVVTVSGQFDVDPTTITVLTQLGISLPVASNLANANECAGTFWSATGFSGGAIIGDATNNRAEANFICGDVANRAFYFTFTYRII